MTDKILDRYAARTPLRGTSTDAGIAASSEDEGTENLGCFGWLRGSRERAVMLELRKKDGSIMAIGYAWLERVEYEPSEGITLHLLGRTIRIKGRNLNAVARSDLRLFEGITRHRVPWLEETRREDSATSEAATAIDSIDW